MATSQVQDLLRFLSQDAKVPLASAMAKVKELQAASLMTPESIAKSDIKAVQSIFDDAKTAKQVYNAAKRVTKKRAAPDGASSSAPSRPGKKARGGMQSSEDLEDALTLPVCDKSPEDLQSIELFTNRAPLVLAFCLTLLKYTMPMQPLSSRLSLAHAYVSISSRSRAVDLGIESGESAQDQGWGAGQPSVRIMGKEIRAMRRSDFQDQASNTERASAAETAKPEIEDAVEMETALWGLDLEALKTSALVMANAGNKNNTMPIYPARSARNYLLRAAGSIPEANEAVDRTTKRQSAKEKAEKVERNLGMLLKAIDLVYESWATEITPRELDSRTWGWYARVRPEIASGKAGWGAKNVVKLKDILALRKTSTSAG